MDIFCHHLVLFLRRSGSPMICSINMPIDADFMVPDLIVDYNMSKQKYTIAHQEEVMGNTSNIQTASSVCLECTDLADINIHQNEEIWKIEGTKSWSNLSKAFACERREIHSHDGTKIPLTIIYSQKMQPKSQSPGLLHGYGAYGEVLDKRWHAELISLLSRGWVIAYAEVRGGGGGGVSWHQAGTGPRKLNSVDDFVSCGIYLINEGYVHKNWLCAMGYSAGGLLVGAAINMHPYLFSAAILKVPFLDVCNTLLDPDLPLTVLDYEEFGDPRNQTEFECIRSYSPCDNVRAGLCYPPMLVTASFNDSRVGVWEAAKWVARVREITCPECSSSVILKTNMSGGHFGEGGRFQQIEEAAFEYAFLIKAIGMLDGK